LRSCAELPKLTYESADRFGGGLGGVGFVRTVKEIPP
jgi:hypothetical protein